MQKNLIISLITGQLVALLPMERGTLYEVWVYKADLGLWEHQRGGRKTYRKIRSQRTETPEETEGHS